VTVAQATAANLNATVTQSTSPWIVAGGGTAGSSGTAALTVQGITGGTPLPVSGTVTATQGAITDTAPATQNITAQDVGSTTTTVANGGSFVTGSPTANSAASFTLASGFDAFLLLVTGTWTGTVTVETSIDGGTTWVSRSIHETGTAYVTSSFTGNFQGGGNAAGATNIRVRATAVWTGTATVKIVETVNPNSLYINNPIRLADSVTPSNQATVKAGSTGATAADTSVVVQLSPNQPNLTTPLNVSAAQAGAYNVNTSATGPAFVAPGAPTTSPYTVGAISSVANPVVGVTGATGATVRVYRIFFANAGSVSTNITIEDSTPTTFSGAFPLQPNGTFNADGGGAPLFVTATGKAFQLVNSAGVQLSGTIWYTQS
jgi:hypothetical protein